MNKGFAQAWDQLAEFAQTRGGLLHRNGHQFFYGWLTDEGTEVRVYAAEDEPRLGMNFGSIEIVDTLHRKGEIRNASISFRTHNIEVLEAIYDALVLAQVLAREEA